MMSYSHTVEQLHYFRHHLMLVPHACDIPDCPGDLNRRKLELFDEMLAALQRSDTLLVAASNFVEQNPVKEYTVRYDEADCDGACLSDDCEIHSKEINDLIAKAKELK